MQGKNLTERIGWRVIVDRFVSTAKKRDIVFAENVLFFLDYKLKDIDNLASLIWFSEAKAKELYKALELPYQTVLEIIDEVAGVKPE